MGSSFCFFLIIIIYFCYFIRIFSYFFLSFSILCVFFYSLFSLHCFDIRRDCFNRVFVRVYFPHIYFFSYFQCASEYEKKYRKFTSDRLFYSNRIKRLNLYFLKKKKTRNRKRERKRLWETSFISNIFIFMFFFSFIYSQTKCLIHSVNLLLYWELKWNYV